MTSIEADRARDLARELVEIFTAYEEELMELERTSPALAPLRRAVGMTIAEACFLIAGRNNSAAEPRSWGK